MMNNEIYLNFDGACYDFDLLVPSGSSWIVEWGDGASEHYVGTGDWQLASHGFYAKGLQCIHIFTENGDDIIGLKSGGHFEGILKRVNISNCPSLMYFENAHAETLDGSCNPKLKELRCEDGTFETLDLSGNPELEKLTLYFCKNVTSLNLSRNPELKELELTCSGVRKLGLNNRSALQLVSLEKDDEDQLDERSKKYMLQILEQNVGRIRRKWEYDE